MTCPVYNNMITCGRVRRSARRCVVCGRPNQLMLCDFPLTGSKQGQTCSRPVCVVHAVHTDPDYDLCPAHARLVATQQEANNS